MDEWCPNCCLEHRPIFSKRRLPIIQETPYKHGKTTKTRNYSQVLYIYMERDQHEIITDYSETQ